MKSFMGCPPQRQPIFHDPSGPPHNGSMLVMLPISVLRSLTRFRVAFADLHGLDEHLGLDWAESLARTTKRSCSNEVEYV